MVINAHLFRIKAFQPRILANLALDELNGHLPGDFHYVLPVFPIVKPSFCPPSYPSIVRIDTCYPWHVETLDKNIKVLEWVYESSFVSCLLKELFFLTVIPCGEEYGMTNAEIVKDLSSHPSHEYYCFL